MLLRDHPRRVHDLGHCRYGHLGHGHCARCGRCADCGRRGFQDCHVLQGCHGFQGCHGLYTQRLLEAAALSVVPASA